MTAALADINVDEQVVGQLACECGRHMHHPGQQRCATAPIYAVRLRHAFKIRGHDGVVVMLCQACLDETTRWATRCIGQYCPGCHRLQAAVSDLIGPVITL
jgi:hypothetical protein